MALNLLSLCLNMHKNGIICSLYKVYIILTWNLVNKMTWSPALGTVRLIDRKMLYVKCVRLCFRNLHVVYLAEKINIPHHSDSHCRCVGSMISSTTLNARDLLLNVYPTANDTVFPYLLSIFSKNLTYIL